MHSLRTEARQDVPGRCRGQVIAALFKRVPQNNSLFAIWSGGNDIDRGFDKLLYTFEVCLGRRRALVAGNNSALQFGVWRASGLQLELLNRGGGAGANAVLAKW